MKSINCKECGRKTKAMSGAMKFCKKCAKAETKKQNRENNVIRKYAIRKARKLTCRECGIDITDFKKKKFYCLDHEAEINKEQVHKYYLKNRQKYLDNMKKYYQVPKNKERHKVLSRESAARKRAALKAVTK